jgi:hypothetical protein
MDDEIIEKVRNRGAAKGELPSPASEAAVSAAEAAIGVTLPTLLRRLYVEVVNGGFGPREGVLGVGGGPWIGDWSSIVEVHSTFIEHPDFPPPAWLVWIFDWGCNIWSLIDCRTSDGRMWSWDANVDENVNPLFETDMTFAQWIESSLDGTLDMPSHP